jgi:predicted MFS family arabinose efflux permease
VSWQKLATGSDSPKLHFAKIPLVPAIAIVTVMFDIALSPGLCETLAGQTEGQRMREDRLSKTTILGMIAMGVAVVVIANDFTALSVALPAIEKDLHSNVTTVQWVINGYAMVFGVLIVTGGRLADMFGRRRIFMTGAAIFAGFSMIGGYASSALQNLLYFSLLAAISDSAGQTRPVRWSRCDERQKKGRMRSSLL